MISCFILGELSTVEILKTNIEKFLLARLVGFSDEPAKGLTFVLNFKPNLIFADANLIARHKTVLTRIAQECPVIYIASYPSHAFEAFEVLAFDYLLKPIAFERFEKSMNKFIYFSLLGPTPEIAIAKRTEPITDSFFIKADVKGQKLISVKYNEVLFIEADQNYVYLHLEGQEKFICHNTMKEMEEGLPMAQFVRVHKSFIINYEKVSSIEGQMIILGHKEKHRILIGNTYRKAFFELKNQKMIKKNKTSFTSLDFYSYTASLLLFIYGTSVNWYSLIDQGLNALIGF